MIQNYLFRVLILFIAIDLVVAGILVIFIINIRIVLKKRFIERRSEIRAIKAAQTSQSTEDAAHLVNISVEEFTEFCKKRSIMLPEERIQRKESAEKKKQDDLRRIMEEEAAWRAEQARVAEEHYREKEEEKRTRNERLKKFGII